MRCQNIATSQKIFTLETKTITMKIIKGELHNNFHWDRKVPKYNQSWLKIGEGTKATASTRKKLLILTSTRMLSIYGTTTWFIVKLLQKVLELKLGKPFKLSKLCCLSGAICAENIVNSTKYMFTNCKHTFKGSCFLFVCLF